MEHSRALRNKLIECFERASSPACTVEEAKRILTFVIVGGGPTSIEFAGELHDFITKDIIRWYPDLRGATRVTVIEASDHLLGNFHSRIVKHVEKTFRSRNIEVLTNLAVKEINENVCTLSDGSHIPFGALVWSAGVKQTKLIDDVEGASKAKSGRLQVDS